MPDGLTEAQVSWTRAFTGLECCRDDVLVGEDPSPGEGESKAPSGPEQREDSEIAEAAPGGPLPEFHGDGEGSKAPLPAEVIKKKALDKIAAGGSIEASDYAGLEADDRDEVLHAWTEAQNKKAAKLQKLSDATSRFLDLTARVTALQRDASAPEAPAIKFAVDLVGPLSELRKAGKLDEMLALLATYEGYVNAAEAVRADRPKYQKQSADAGGKIAKMTDSQLESLPPKDSAQLISDLVAAGEPAGDIKKAQVRLYKHTKLDHAFVKVDESKEKQVAASLKGDKELETARKKWGHFDPAAKIAALQELAEAQCKVYGITTPEIVRMKPEEEAPKNGFVVEGGYQPDGKIHLNFGPDAKTKDFQPMMVTIFHEVAHHYQHTLAEKYTKNQLKPDDPLYAQAALFAANDLPGANINDQDINAHPENSKELEKGYRGQPNERHSFKTSEAMASATLKML